MCNPMSNEKEKENGNQLLIGHWRTDPLFLNLRSSEIHLFYKYRSIDIPVVGKIFILLFESRVSVRPYKSLTNLNKGKETRDCTSRAFSFA